MYPQDHKELVPYGKNVQSDALSATDGLTNTDLAQKVSDTGEISAVTVCNNLVGFGFDDWYLPSRYELDAIYKQSYLVKGLNYNGSYWSSTESSKNTAWYQSFNFGIQMEDNKVHLYSCRCVRKDKQD